MFGVKSCANHEGFTHLLPKIKVSEITFQLHLNTNSKQQSVNYILCFNREEYNYIYISKLRPPGGYVKASLYGRKIVRRHI